MWLLGLKLRTSGRAVSALNHWAISPAYTWYPQAFISSFYKGLSLWLYVALTTNPLTILIKTHQGLRSQHTHFGETQFIDSLNLPTFVHYSSFQATGVVCYNPDISSFPGSHATSQGDLNKGLPPTTIAADSATAHNPAFTGNFHFSYKAFIFKRLSERSHTPLSEWSFSPW